MSFGSGPPAGTDAIGLDDLWRLARQFTPYAPVGAVKRRFGAPRDGGYVMLDVTADVGLAFSLGIGPDVSWDVDVAERGVLVHQYDHTVDGPPVAHPGFRFHKARIAATPDTGAVTLGEALAAGRAERPTGDAILKIDIEGSEWDVFDAASADVLDGFTQIVCEFHGFEQAANALWYARAMRVTDKLNARFGVVHIHGNNFAPLLDWGAYRMPAVLEVSYAHRARFAFAPTLDWFPTALDFPNFPDRADHLLARFDFGMRRQAPAASGRAPPVQSWLLRRSGGTGDLSDASVDWMKTIGHAARDHALPMLATVAEQAGVMDSLPPDVAAYLDYVLSANVRANSAIRSEVLFVGRALARANVDAILLKGATWLFEPGSGLYDRMMRDIDILVAPGDLEAAVAALIAAGFERSPLVIGEAGHIHEHPLRHPDHPVLVEVHVELATRPELLPTRPIFERSSVVAPGLAIPAFCDRIVHNVIHAQLTNGEYRGGVLNLRDATDLGRLVEAAFDSCDWQQLERDAAAGFYRAPLAAALHQAAYVTGCPVPPPFVDDRRAANHLRRSLLQRRWGWLDTLMRPLGFLARATAWERDAYALGLGDRRDLAAHLLVNRRRVGRAARRLRRLFKG